MPNTFGSIGQGFNWGRHNVLNDQVSQGISDRIFDFVANPAGLTVTYNLPNVSGIRGFSNNLFSYPNSGPDEVPGNGSLFGFQPDIDPDERFAWQIRQWENGVATKLTPIEKRDGVEFTKVKDCSTWKVPPSTVGGSILVGTGTEFTATNTLLVPKTTHTATAAGGQSSIAILSMYPSCNGNTVGGPFSNFTNTGGGGNNPVSNVPGQVNKHIWNVFQKAVAIVKDGAGNVLTNLVKTNQLSSDHQIFNASGSYGCEYTGPVGMFGNIQNIQGTQWIIEKSPDSGATWVTAVGGGVDYTLVSGSLTASGTIDLTFSAPGTYVPAIKYRVTFIATGFSSQFVGGAIKMFYPNSYPTGNSVLAPASVPASMGSNFMNPIYLNSNQDYWGGHSGPNTDQWQATIEVVNNSTLTDTSTTITLPNVLPIVLDDGAPKNHVISTAPFEADGPVEIEVDAFLDKTAASKSTTVTIKDAITNVVQSTTTNTLLDSNSPDSAWISEINSQSYVSCVVRDLNQPIGTGGNFRTIAIRSGFGPHTFNLGPGKYDTGYRLNQKIITNTGPLNAGPPPVGPPPIFVFGP